MTMTEQAFRQLALEDPAGHWELDCGDPYRKPGMTLEHNDLMIEFAGRLWQQTDPDRFRARVNAGHVRISPGRYFIPGVFVMPVALREPWRGTRQLEPHEDPFPSSSRSGRPRPAATTSRSSHASIGDAPTWRSGAFTYERRIGFLNDLFYGPERYRRTRRGVNSVSV